MSVHKPDFTPVAHPGVPIMDAKAEPTLKYPGIRGLLCRVPAGAEPARPALPARRHLRALGLYGHHPRRPRTSTSSARPATTRASSRISRTSATRSRSRMTAGSARSSRASTSSTSSSPRRTAPCRSAINGSRTRARSRCSAQPVRIVGPTELIWSKCFIQLRHRYDGADVAHTILKAHRPDRLARASRLHGSALGGAAHAPAELPLDLPYRARQCSALGHGRACSTGLSKQLDLPPPQMKVCRGRMFSRIDYEIDVKQWGFADVGGEGEWRND